MNVWFLFLLACTDKESTEPSSEGDIVEDQDGDGYTTAEDCDDENPCTSDLCVEGNCANPPGNEGDPCDDGDLCTEGDTCGGEGTCQGGAAVTCDATTTSCGRFESLARNSGRAARTQLTVPKKLTSITRRTASQSGSGKSRYSQLPALRMAMFV